MPDAIFTRSATHLICPNCGYIILLDEKILSEEIKLSARGLKEEDPLLYRKNNLKSELIYLESITPKVKERTKINWWKIIKEVLTWDYLVK